MNSKPNAQIQTLLSAARQRIFPSDGMAITADVWAESHDFHRVVQQLHQQHAHAPGVLTGLEVLPINPPSAHVVVMPGAALDDEGRTIVLHESRTVQVPTAGGAWPRLMLQYDESKPQRDTTSERAELNVQLVEHQFQLVWAYGEASSGQVELARVRVVADSIPPTIPAAIRKASNPLHPTLHEIDLRFRCHLARAPKSPASVAVLTVGAASHAAQPDDSLAGLHAWAAGLNRAGALCVGVDADTDLLSHLNDYTLVVLRLGQLTNQSLQVPSALTDALHEYVLRYGGTLWVEAFEGWAGAQHTADVLSLFSSLALKLDEMPNDHELLRRPHVFGAPPPGFAGVAPQVFVGNGVVFCAGNYSRVLHGLQQAGPAVRQTIRDAAEFGENILSFALRRKGYDEG